MDQPGSVAMFHRDNLIICPLRYHGSIRWNRVRHLPAILDAIRPDAAAEVVSVHRTNVTDNRHGNGGGATCGVAGDDDRTA